MVLRFLSDEVLEMFHEVPPFLRNSMLQTAAISASIQGKKVKTSPKQLGRKGLWEETLIRNIQ